MKHWKKIPILFFMLIYANQGLSALPSQCLYYLQRETWGLSAFQLGLVAFVIGLAWCVKPFFGFLTDCFSIKNYRTKYYLLTNYILLISTYLYIIFFGLNFYSLLITGFIISSALAFSDVCNDTQMIILEKKYDLKGRIQAIQWSSLSVAGLFVAICGALIADKIPEPLNYKVAYGLILALPILTFLYLKKNYKEKPIKKKVEFKTFLKLFKIFKNKNFVLCLLFIAFLNFSPSFGYALTIKLREHMGVGKMFLGWLGATGTVLGLVGYAIYYWKAYKVDMKKLLYFMIIFSAITNLFYLYLPNKWIILIYSIMFGAFNGIAFLTLLSFFARIVPTGGEGLFYALVTSVSNLTARLGGVFGGAIYDNFGYNINVIFASATTLMCLCFVPYLKMEVSKNEL